MFEQVFTNVDNVLRRASRCTMELDHSLRRGFLQAEPRAFVAPETSAL